MKKKILLLAYFFFLFKDGDSQIKPLELGGKFINEIADWKNYAPGLGLQAVQRFTNHSCIETGFYFKVKPEFFIIYTVPINYTREKINEKTILIPLLYRFESFKINFTAGMEVDYLINKKNIEKYHLFLPGAPEATRSEIVSTVSISKNFYAGRGLIIEPELRARAFVPRGGGGISLNIAIRKRRSSTF